MWLIATVLDSPALDGLTVCLMVFSGLQNLF